MKIILVRHGESEHNAGKTESKDSKLTKRGEIQARHLGGKLKKEKIKISEIYTSHLIRSKQTAEIISKIIKVPVKKEFTELNEYHEKFLKIPLIKYFNLRIGKLKKLLKKITKDREKDKTIMIVAHGITNRIIIGHLLKIPIGKKLLRFVHHNVGLSTLRWNKKHKDWMLESMNDVSHLPRRLKEY